MLKASLQGITRRNVGASAIINSGGWRGNNWLVYLACGHYRVGHSKDEFARGHVHVNGIEALEKVHTAKFKSLPKHASSCI